jgi:outer membrane autotransporter protein
VTVNPGAAAGAFTSNTVFPTTGFLLESFGQSPSGSTQFGVIQKINPSATSIGGLSRVGAAVAATLDEPIAPYVNARMGAGAEDRRIGLWIRGTTGYTKEILNTSIVGGGIATSSVDRLVTDDTTLQVGADFGMVMGSSNWNLHLGAMGGWYEASADLAGYDRVKLNAPFIGAYVTLDNGPFAVEGAVRHEWRKFDVRLPSLFGSAAARQLDGSATAGSVYASYRFGGARGFAATPMIGFSYGDSGIDDLAIGPQNAFSPDNYKTEVGQAGVRLSYLALTGAGAVIEPFAGAALRQNWSRFDRGTYSFGASATTFSLETASWHNAVRYSAGFTAHDATGRISMFVVGIVDDGSKVDSASLTGGVRIEF